MAPLLVRSAAVHSWGSSAISRRRALSLFFSTSLAAKAAESGASAGPLALPPLREGERRLYLVRHGETDWNVQGRIQGRTDNALNDNGIAQARALSRLLATEPPLDVITSSNLVRARQTANEVAAAQPSAKRMPPSSAFAEMCFGRFEGEILEEVEDEYKAYVTAWRAGEDVAWPGTGGESPNVVAARGLAGLRKLGVMPSSAKSLAAAEPRRFLVAAHGRFNKIVLAALQGDVTKASDIKQGNTCLNVVDFQPDGTAIVRAVNVQTHLLGVGAALGGV